MPRLYAAALVALCFAAVAQGQGVPAGDAGRGKRIYTTYGCYQCHGYQGQGSNAGSKIAPDPTPYLAFALQLRTPRARMPAYTARVVSDQEVADLYAYLLTIPKARPVSEIPLLSPRATNGE